MIYSPPILLYQRNAYVNILFIMLWYNDLYEQSLAGFFGL